MSNDNDPAPPTATTAPAQPAADNSNRRPLLISAVILIVIIIAAVIAYFSVHSQPTNQPGSAMLGLTSYTLKGYGSNRGMTFLKTNQMTTDPDKTITQLPGQVGLGYNANGYTEAYIAAASPVKSGSDYNSQTRSTISEALNNPQSNDYPKYASQPEFFASGIFSGAAIHFGSLEPFTNSYVTSDAWRIDMQITSSSTSRTGTGDLIYILGKNGYYYLFLEANSQYWQSHAQDWPKILNSIRVDQ